MFKILCELCGLPLRTLRLIILPQGTQRISQSAQSVQVNRMEFHTVKNRIIHLFPNSPKNKTIVESFNIKPTEFGGFKF